MIQASMTAWSANVAMSLTLETGLNGTSAPTAEGVVLGEMYKNSGKWYNLIVQVAAGRTIKYTAELRHRHESRYLSADGVSFGVAV